MRITLPNVWPFMKLPNGFSSHRYLYSPILFDSQDIYPKDVKKVSELNPHALPTAGGTPVLLLLYLPRYVGRRWRMEMQTEFTSSASWLQVQHLKMTMVTGLLPMGNGNAYDQLGILVPAACTSPGTMPLGWRVSAMGNGECSPASQPTLRGTLAAPSIY